VSAMFHEPDEAAERDLFERRARARHGATGVPSLEAVLRAAQDDSRETSNGRGRAWTGLALAAACLVTVVKTRPHEISPSAIVADVDGATSGTTERGDDICEEQAVSACTLDSTNASVVAVAPITQESRACMAPPATFESSGTLSCDRDEANRTEMP
jgi:hypothetical protein